MGIGRGRRQPGALLISRVSLGPPGDSGKLRQASNGRRHRDDDKASIRPSTEGRCPRCHDTIRVFL